MLYSIVSLVDQLYCECLKSLITVVKLTERAAFLSMGWKCCVPGCRSGYATSTSTSNERVSFHAFSKSNTSAWLKAIHRMDYVPTSNSRVCSLHFVESDFKTSSTDMDCTRLKNRTSDKLALRLLKPTAVPSIFRGQPKYLSKVTVKPSQSCLGAAESRREKEEERIAQLEEQFFESNKINDFTDFCEKVKSACIPSGFEVFHRENFVLFILMDIENRHPSVECSLRISAPNLHMDIGFRGAHVSHKHVAHVLEGKEVSCRQQN